MVTIVIKGHLDKNWKDWFDGMKITYKDDTTVLTGNVIDNSQLHGILNRIRDLNLKLVSVNTLDDNLNIEEKK